MTASSPDHPRSAVIQVAASTVNGPRRTIASTFQGMQSKRLVLEATERVPISTAVSVEYEDALFLGEVMVCSGSNSTWNIEIRIEQILTGLQSLVALRDRLLGDGVPKIFELMPLGHRN